MRVETFRVGTLVLTASKDGSGGYELLIEVDKSDDAPTVHVSIGTASGDIAEIEL